MSAKISNMFFLFDPGSLIVRLIIESELDYEWSLFPHSFLVSRDNIFLRLLFEEEAGDGLTVRFVEQKKLLELTWKN